MHKAARHWSVIAWIACLAILFNAFAPVVSHASESRGSAPATVEIEVCTALGMTMVPASDAPVAADKSDHLHKGMNHCGYCVVHAATHGLPPPMTVAFVPSVSRDVYPPLYYHGPRPLFPWAQAQARAPPALA